MTQPFLTVYNYGTGGVWTYLRAESPEQIHEKFRDLKVLTAPPSWMTEVERKRIRSYDLATAEVDDPVFLARLVRRPSK